MDDSCWPRLQDISEPSRAWLTKIRFGFYHGPLPAGTHVSRACGNPDCENPEHWQRVSPGQKVRLVVEYLNDQDRTEKLYRTILEGAR